MISTRDLTQLPTVDALRRLMQSLAMLDAILCPEWQYRYFSFDGRWAPGAQMGSMRNGQGDHYFALFNATGCWLKGFDHEAAMSPFAAEPLMVAPGVLDAVPPEFAACLLQPAFVVSETTFCIWRRYADAAWQRGPVVFPAGVPDPDGSEHLLQWLDGHPETYRRWAQEYYERHVSAAAVQTLYAHEGLDDLLIAGLNSELNLSALGKDVAEIGYPVW